MKEKVGLLSLGCPRNIVDSESILAQFKAQGHRIVNLDKADIAVLNTCAFIEEAKRESIDAILGLIELKKEGRLKKIFVYGCLPQRYAKELAKGFPEVDLFQGCRSLDKGRERVGITAKHYAYLKICEGCVEVCSFCAIPRIKGKLKSLESRLVFAKVQDFNRQRISELNIIGQDISGYGLDLYGSPALTKLLKGIIRRSSNIGWLRLLYLNPARVSDELLRIISQEERVCKYIDMPVQHINDRILRAMSRRMRGADILKAIERVRSRLPGAAIRTSVIVGFPSETEKEFQELLSFLAEAQFERLGAFIYSREEGTPAYNLEGQLPAKVKRERFSRVMELQQKISRQVNARQMGKVLRVLIDESEDGRYLGRSEFDAPEVDGQVYVYSKKKLRRGDFTDVRITDTLEYDLVGEA